MKVFKLLVILLLASGTSNAQQATVKAPTVDDILNKYYENSGGKALWDSLKSVRMTGQVSVQGMEIPVTIIQTAAGQQKVSIKFQGQEITQVAFDGEKGWNTDFMNQKAEKMSAEANANTKQQVMDFPDALHNYKAKGYLAQLEGKEMIEGKEAFKVKLIKTPVKLDGQEQENIVYYFFDPENYLPVAMRNMSLSGQTKGASVETLLDDYRQVQGLLFPFSSKISYNGQPGETIQLENIETNAKFDPKLFAFPE
ncbi:outer membrane lipoprotein-sorting protein [Salmonirosea aquatica]|uniref:Outer membrane lipoprotein-sorting protein n=1 Tax=Salmonirosea aquatica TaxID=2654236 RepID=A0A7C9FBE7_9BACT|nr:outer membrane lipoprotein-sorting protein [Cytophagaceae bacterium SJW1-29]